MGRGQLRRRKLSGPWCACLGMGLGRTARSSMLAMLLDTPGPACRRAGVRAVGQGRRLVPGLRMPAGNPSPRTTASVRHPRWCSAFDWRLIHGWRGRMLRLRQHRIGDGAANRVQHTQVAHFVAVVVQLRHGVVGRVPRGVVVLALGNGVGLGLRLGGVWVAGQVASPKVAGTNAPACLDCSTRRKSLR